MKHYMKSLILILLIISIIFSNVGCGNKKITDGNYTIKVSLEGGSGRAKIDSPTDLVVENEKFIATVIWSSPFYEYMIVDDIKYNPIQESGNATFKIPVTLDVDMKITACTVRMSEPHEIDYVLHFDSSTLKEK